MKRAAETELVGGPKEKHERADEIVEVREDDVDTCPICMDIMGIRVMKNIMCTHAVCSACNRDLEKCPMCRAEWQPMSEKLQKDNVRIICSECNSKVAYTKFHAHSCKGNSCPDGCGWFGKRNCSGSAHPCRLQKCVLCSGEDHLVMKCPKVTEMGTPFTNAKDLPNRDVALLLAKCIESGQKMDSALFQRVMRNKRLHPYAMEHVRVLCENNKIYSTDMINLIEASDKCDGKKREHYFRIASFFPQNSMFLNPLAVTLNAKMKYETVAFYVDYIVSKPVEYYADARSECMILLARMMMRAADWARLNLSHIPDMDEVLPTSVTSNQRRTFMKTIIHVMEDVVDVMVRREMFDNAKFVANIVKTLTSSLLRILGYDRGLRLLQKLEDECIEFGKPVTHKQLECIYEIHRKMYSLYILHDKFTEFRLLCDKMYCVIQHTPLDHRMSILAYTSVFQDMMSDAVKIDYRDGNYERARVTLEKSIPTFKFLNKIKMNDNHLMYTNITKNLGFKKRHQEVKRYMDQHFEKKFNGRFFIGEVSPIAEE